MKEKIRRYAKEALLFVLLLFVLSTLISIYRTSEMNIDDAVCKKGADIVYFWATWCPVCKATSPNVDRISKRFEVLGIAVKSGDDAQIRNYMQEHGLHFRNLNDTDAHLARQNGVGVFPTVVFCNKGEVQFVESGYTSSLGLWLRAYIASL